MVNTYLLYLDLGQIHCISLYLEITKGIQCSRARSAQDFFEVFPWKCTTPEDNIREPSLSEAKAACKEPALSHCSGFLVKVCAGWAHEPRRARSGLGLPTGGIADRRPGTCRCTYFTLLYFTLCTVRDTPVLYCICHCICIVFGLRLNTMYFIVFIGGIHCI